MYLIFKMSMAMLQPPASRHVTMEVLAQHLTPARVQIISQEHTASLRKNTAMVTLLLPITPTRNATLSEYGIG